MSYAIRKGDNTAFRSIGGPDDLMVDEFYSETPPSLGLIKISKDQIERERLYAYAHPVSGSDRYFSEANVEEDAGNSENAEASRVLGRARRLEIQQMYPWGEES